MTHRIVVSMMLLATIVFAFSKPKVRVKLSKAAYHFDEAIPVTIVNNSAKPITFCLVDFPEPVLFRFEVNEGRGWEKIGDMRNDTTIPTWHSVVLAPGQTYNYSEHLTVPGTWRLVLDFSSDLSSRLNCPLGKRKTVRSSAFVILTPAAEPVH